MNTIELDTKFFTGGNSTFTVDNGQGVHYTFKIRHRQGQHQRRQGPLAILFRPV